MPRAAAAVAVAVAGRALPALQHDFAGGEFDRHRPIFFMTHRAAASSGSSLHAFPQAGHALPR
ncbi:MAG: hypothetical protein ABSH33_11465 [Steroidobacteraceae bacterium]